MSLVPNDKLHLPCAVHCVHDLLFVSDMPLNRVAVFRYEMHQSTYTYITSFGSQGCGDGEFQGTAGIASLHNQYLYVVDCGNDRVCVFKQNDFSFVTSFGSEFLCGPLFICISELDKRLYVTARNGMLAFHLHDYSFVGRIGDDILVDPKGICLSSNGSSLIVAEHRINRISEFDPINNDIIRTVGLRCTAKRQTTPIEKDLILHGPVSVCLSADESHILVVEYYAGCISLFKQSDFSFVARMRKSGDKARNLNSPRSVACDCFGNTLVADTFNQCVVAFCV
jgi:hypothetical protein